MCEITLTDAKARLSMLQTRLDNLYTWCPKSLDRLPSASEPAHSWDIIKTEIAELRAELDRLEKEQVTTIPASLKRRLRALGLMVGLFISETSKIRFINQNDELDALTGSSASPFQALEAPIGYGKTFLLYRARQKLEKKNWRIVQVNLSDLPDKINNPQDFMLAVWDALPEEYAPFPSLDLLGSIRDKLAGKIENLGKSVIVFIDGAEKISDPELIKWIRQEIILFSIADHKKKFPANKLRWVIAGRYIYERWNDPSLKYSPQQIRLERVRLGAFTNEFIFKAVDGLFDSTKKPSFSTIKTIADTADHICGGHPECIVSLLLHFASSNFVVTTDHRQLFRDHVAPSCQAMLNDNLPDDLRNVLPYLSLFRCYDAAIIQLVLDCLRERAIFTTTSSAEQIMRDMNSLGLIIWNREKGYWTDSVIRKVLSYQLWLDSSNTQDSALLALELNEIAMEKYRSWLDDEKSWEFPRYNAVIQELLYHTSVDLAHRPDVTQEQANRVFECAVADCYQAFSEKLKRDHYDQLRSETRLNDLAMELEGDEEIEANFASLHIDSDGYRQLLRIIDPQISPAY